MSGFAPGLKDGVRPGDLVEVRLARAARILGVVLDDASAQPLEGVQIVAKLPGKLGDREQISDALGAFAFEDLPSGFIGLAIHAPEHVIPEPEEHELAVGEEKEIEVRLTAGKVIEGTLLSLRDDLPLENGEVTIGKRTGISDRRGQFEVRGLPASQLNVEARAEGHLPEGRNVNLSGSRRKAEVVFRLRHGAAVFGRVSGEDDTPVAGAQIKLFQSWGSGIRHMWEDWSTRRCEVVTDEFGQFELAGIQPQSWANYVVRAKAEGRPDAYSPTLKIKKPEDRVPVDIRFSLGAEIAGQVLDHDRNPVGGARVSLNPESVYGWSAHQRKQNVVGTDDEGKFRFHGISEGAYHVFVDARGYSRGWKNGLKVEGRQGPPHVEIKLWKGEPIAGVVIDRDDNPLEGAKVTASAKGGQGTAVSDAEGRFDIAAVPEGPWRITASLEGYGRYVKSKVQVGADGLVRVEMSPQAVIRGRVIDAATSKPIRSFRIALSKEDERRQGRMRTYFNQMFQSREGEFQVQLPDGTYRMDVFSHGYVRHRVDKMKFEAGVEVDDLEFRLHRGGAIEGYVRDTAGKPMSRVNVYRRLSLGSDDLWSRCTQTEHDGYFFVGDLDANSYDLALHRAGFPIERDLGIMVGGEAPAWREMTLNRVTRLQVKIVSPKTKKGITSGQRPVPGRFGNWRSNRSRGPRTTLHIESRDLEPLVISRSKSDPSRGSLYAVKSTRTNTYGGSFTATLTDLPIGRYRVKASQAGLPDIEHNIHLGHGANPVLLIDFAALKKALAPEETPAASPMPVKHRDK